MDNFLVSKQTVHQTKKLKPSINSFDIEVVFHLRLNINFEPALTNVSDLFFYDKCHILIGKDTQKQIAVLNFLFN